MSVKDKPVISVDKMPNETAKRNGPIAELRNNTSILNAGYGDDDSLYIRKAYGCFIEDFSGNTYIDTALGAGTHILGHANPLIVSEIEKQAREGTLYILPNEYAMEVGRLLLQAIPCFNSFVFCNSGTEATIRATRIARAYTGKKKIAMFSGGWHGGNDMLLFEEDYRGDESKPVPTFKSAGVPEEVLNMMLMLPYNNDAAFDLIEQHKDELAMVIIEPSQGSNPRDDVGDFLRELRRVTAKHNILLCFDEIVTGFRVALGGCQEYYGVKADIVTYGKAIGGGLPVGLIGGTEDVMKVTKGCNGEKPVFMGGTFSANPLVMRIAKTVLQHLIENKGQIYNYLNENGRYIRNKVNDFCVSNQISVRMMGIGSMSRLIFTDKTVKSRRDRDEYEADDTLQKLFYSCLRFEKGVHISSNRVVFLSTAHEKEHVEKIASSIIETLEYLSKRRGLFH